MIRKCVDFKWTTTKEELLRKSRLQFLVPIFLQVMLLILISLHLCFASDLSLEVFPKHKDSEGNECPISFKR